MIHNKRIMQNSLFVTVKQSEIRKLQKQIKDYGDFCKSIQRCFDKQALKLQYTINDKTYQIEMLKVQLSRCKEEVEKQKKTIEKQKKEIVDLNKAFNHLFGEAFDEDVEINYKSDQDVEIVCKSDQDVEIDCTSDSRCHDPDVEDLNESSSE